MQSGEASRPESHGWQDGKIACGADGLCRGRHEMKFNAQERRWVMRLLSRLTPEQRARYEAACREAPRHHRTGKLYDDAKARIAERILYDDMMVAMDRAADSRAWEIAPDSQTFRCPSCGAETTSHKLSPHFRCRCGLRLKKVSFDDVINARTGISVFD